MEDKILKITKCVGEGQGSCKRCAEIRGWNRLWMCFLYKIDGYDGLYCYKCVLAISAEVREKEKQERGEINGTK